MTLSSARLAGARNHWRPALPLLALGAIGLLACAQDEQQGSPTGAECDPYLYYELEIAPLMDRYCVSCHAQDLPLSQRHGAPGDHDFDSKQGVLNNAEHVALVAAGGPLAINRSMPPGGSKQPSDAERKLLGQWLACQNGTVHGGHAH